MFVVPSPETLLHHRNPLFSNQITTVEFFSNTPIAEPASPRQFPNLSIDLYFAWSKNRMKTPILSKSGIISILSAFVSSRSIRKFIFFAILALDVGDYETAITFLTEAAKQKSYDAMNLIGNIYSKNQSLGELPFKWYLRALRLNSIESLELIGKNMYSIGNYNRALHFFYSHFSKTSSIFDAKNIVMSLKSLLNLNVNDGIIEKKDKIVELYLKWLRFCASNGEKTAINYIFDEMNQNPFQFKKLLMWLSIATKFNILANQTYCFPPLLKANFGAESDVSIKEHLNIHEIINSSSQNIQPNSFIENKKSIQNNDKKNKAFVKSFTMFPSTSKTSLLLQIFHYSSPDFEQRNLCICDTLLKRFNNEFKESIYDSDIWRSKFFSNNLENHIHFGFICFLLEDYQQSYYSFKKAAILGSDIGLCMCGLILFYGIYKKRYVKKSMYFFSKCKKDAISLLHLGISCADDLYIKRASKITGKNSKNGELYEYLGDFFFNGIKYPRELTISKMIYGYGIFECQKNGNSTSNLSNKLVQCVSSLQYFG